MSTSGRINKTRGKFQPRRPTGTASRSNQTSITPKQLAVELPRLEEAEDEDNEPSRLLSPKRVVKPQQRTTNLSVFAPSDPSQRSPSSPSSSPDRSQPQSSFGFGTQPTLTQATSIGGSSQAFPSSSGFFPLPSPTLPLPSLDLPLPSPTLPIPPPLPASSTSDSSLGLPIPLSLPIVSVGTVHEGSTEAKGKGRARGKGKGKRKERAARDEELVTSKKANKVGNSRSAFSSRPKRSTTKTSKRTADDDNKEGEEEEETDQGEENAAKRPTRVPKTAKRAKGEKAKKVIEDGESSQDEWDTMKQKKRRLRKAPKKRGIVDEMLFGDDDDDDDSSPEGGEYSPAEGDGSGSDSDSRARQGRKRVASSSRKENEPEKKQKKQKRSELEPLPPVNPTQTTMSQLADFDPGFEIGRPSERTLFFEKQKVDKKEAMKLKRIKMKERRNRRVAGLPSDSEAEGEEGVVEGEKRARGKGKEKAGSRETSPQALDAAKAMALIGGMRRDRDGDDDDELTGGEGGGEIATTSKGGEEEEEEEEGEEEEEEEEERDGYGDLVESTMAPQMRIVDGNLVLDEDSLQIDRSKPTDTGPREVIEESAQDRFVNSRSFSKKPGKSRKWTVDDTGRFYDALSQFGTDFELISALFPGRTRREIKLKWTKEDKINPKGITAALMQRKKIDLESYAKFSGQDLTGPTPTDPMDEINERRAKLEAEGHSIGGAGHRRGQDGSHGADKKVKGKKKRGPIDEAGAALFDDDAIAREQEEEERRKMEEEQAEEERQARIDAMEAEEGDD